MNSQSDGFRNNVIAVNLLAVISIALRFVARQIRQVTVGVDDYLIVASLVGPLSVTLPKFNTNKMFV